MPLIDQVPYTPDYTSPVVGILLQDEETLVSPSTSTHATHSTNLAGHITNHDETVPSTSEQPTYVWQHRVTGECFSSYEAYLDKMEQYRKRQYTCSKSQTSHLTLEECLLSEQRHSPVESFPKAWRKRTLLLAVDSNARLDYLAERVYFYYQYRFAINERVSFNGQTVKVVAPESYEDDKDHALYMRQCLKACEEKDVSDERRLVQIIPGLAKDRLAVHSDAPMAPLYRVKFPDGKEQVVNATQLRRDKLIYNKLHFRRYLKENLQRCDQSIQSPWRIKPETAQQLKLTIKSSPAQQRQRQKYPCPDDLVPREYHLKHPLPRLQSLTGDEFILWSCWIWLRAHCQPLSLFPFGWRTFLDTVKGKEATVKQEDNENNEEQTTQESESEQGDNENNLLNHVIYAILILWKNHCNGTLTLLNTLTSQSFQCDYVWESANLNLSNVWQHLLNLLKELTVLMTEDERKSVAEWIENQDENSAIELPSFQALSFHAKVFIFQFLVSVSTSCAPLKAWMEQEQDACLQARKILRENEASRKRLSKESANNKVYQQCLENIEMSLTQLRRHSTFRLIPLGKDRWNRVYYYVDEVGIPEWVENVYGVYGKGVVHRVGGSGGIWVMASTEEQENAVPKVSLPTKRGRKKTPDSAPLQDVQDINTHGSYQTKEELDTLLQNLVPKGLNECHLQKSIREHYELITASMEGESTPFKPQGKRGVKRHVVDSEYYNYWFEEVE